MRGVSELAVTGRHRSWYGMARCILPRTLDRMRKSSLLMTLLLATLLLIAIVALLVPPVHLGLKGHAGSCMLLIVHHAEATRQRPGALEALDKLMASASPHHEPSMVVFLRATSSSSVRAGPHGSDPHSTTTSTSPRLFPNVGMHFSDKRPSSAMRLVRINIGISAAELQALMASRLDSSAAAKPCTVEMDSGVTSECV